MKVAMPKDYKRYYTIEEYEIAKRIISDMKEDTETPKGWADMAIREALKGTPDCPTEIYTASAEISKNCRAWNLYFDDSRSVDVWVRFAARTCNGFIEGGAYLSDIWQTGATPYRQHMYTQYYIGTKELS